MSSPVFRGPRRPQAEERAHIDAVRDYFNNLRSFRFEHVIGNGAYGITFAVVERRFGLRGLRQRRLAVKRAKVRMFEEELRDEIYMMMSKRTFRGRYPILTNWGAVVVTQKLNGAAHLPSIIASSDDAAWSRRRPGLLRRLASALTCRWQDDLPAGLGGPTLIMEYLENGDLDRLRRRLASRDMELPNRLLWGIYLCLIRACVGMKFSAEKPLGSRAQLEEIPADQSEPGNILHGDMHSGNVLIGAPGDFPEHSLTPPIKLIDFGLSQTHTLSEHQNLADASRQMLYLIARREYPIDYDEAAYNGLYTRAWDLVRPRDGGRLPYPRLDPELRELLAWCLASEPAEQPALAEVLEACRRAVATRDPRFYREDGPRETDRAIQYVLQKCVYDADDGDAEGDAGADAR
ncbi:kinase-like domain-containing protein [Xylaria palmicola]|nr:kinase-like domain-containing protein [Xylaria palmicola]